MSDRGKFFKTHVIIVLAMIVGLFVTTSTHGQAGRSYIREQISNSRACRNVAITKANGDLMLYGDNGWAGAGLPNGLPEALNALNKEGQYIDDVQITEEGRWLILYGDCGFKWNDIPYSLEQKLREYNNHTEVVTSVTFNDNDDWILISRNYYTSSDERISAWLKEGATQYGQLWAACVTDDAIVAVFERGYSFLGNVPQSLQKELDKTKLDVYRLKIAGSAWFYADFKGNYRYNM